MSEGVDYMDEKPCFTSGLFSLPPVCNCHVMNWLSVPAALTSLP